MAGGAPIEYTHFVWTPHTLATLKAKVAHTSQTVFEFFTVFMVLAAFRRIVRQHGVLLGGDNLTSLQNLLHLRSGVTNLNAICREISWRKVLDNWRVCPVHYPKEYNVVADALSRLHAPDPSPRPSSALRGASFRIAPLQDDSLWLARFDRPPSAC